MKNSFENPASPSKEEAKALFDKMREATESPSDAKDAKKFAPRTGAGAMAEWQKEQEDKEDEHFRKAA